MNWGTIIFIGLFLFAGGVLLGSMETPELLNNIEVPEKAVEPLLLEPAAQELPVFEPVTPHNRVPEENIHVYQDRIVLDIPNAKWARFADTNSMLPVLDKGSNAIQGTPSTTADVHVGDIISFKREKETIIHRVVDTGNDEQGWYAITKGDNNPIPDAGKLRFEDIISIVLAVIY